MAMIPLLLGMFMLVMGSIVLQVALCRIENKWLGLILPIFTFVLSIALVFLNGLVVKSVVIFVLVNIFTLIYLGIYLVFYIHKNRNDRKQIEKMSIKDL